LTSSFSDDDAVTTTPNKSPITSHNNDSVPSSLGAVAGPQGVALFRLSRPHVPLLILSHATNTTTAGSSISSLAFQPTTNSSGASGSGGANNSAAAPPSLYLAAARGSGILVWDASGHSSSPLMGRLSVDHSSNHMSNSLSAGTISTSASDARITSIAWKPSTVAPILAATTLTSLSLWDLRAAPVSTSFSTEIFKPSLRFGSVRKSGLESAVVVQVACASNTEECATIDSSGTVRLYDVRMSERSRSSNAMSLFSAHDARGVGICYMDNNKSQQQSNDATSTSTSWLTWGMESPSNSSAIVKVWSSNHRESSDHNSNPDEYWYMDGSPKPPQNTVVPPSDYRLVAQCASPNLACARVCASPIENSLLVVGHLPDIGGNWWAELYQLSTSPEEDSALQSRHNATFGLDKIVGFSGPNSLSSVLGSRGANLGGLRAAELAFSSSIRTTRPSYTEEGIQSSDGHEEERNTNEVELLLCCLSDTGIVTTHVRLIQVDEPNMSLPISSSNACPFFLSSIVRQIGNPRGAPTTACGYWKACWFSDWTSFRLSPFTHCIYDWDAGTGVLGRKRRHGSGRRRRFLGGWRWRRRCYNSNESFGRSTSVSRTSFVSDAL
jgi:hypothetical protein